MASSSYGVTPTICGGDAPSFGSLAPSSTSDICTFDEQSPPHDFWEDVITSNHASSNNPPPINSSSNGQSDSQAQRDRTTTALHTTTAKIFRGDANLVETYAPAIGRIVRKSYERPLETCFLIAPATVMTCFHVIPKASKPDECKAQFFGRTAMEESHRSIQKVVYTDFLLRLTYQVPTTTDAYFTIQAFHPFWLIL